MDTNGTRRGYRTKATTRVAVFAALLVALFSILAISPAEAAGQKRSKGFAAPTSVTYVSTVCTPTPDGRWDITATFKVSGGRYANYGNPATADLYTKADKVYGGARYIDSTISYGAGDESYYGLTFTETFYFQQEIAPLTKASRTNFASRQIIAEEIPATFTC